MVEPFSASFAIAGLPGMFNACVESFDYIQLGHHFGTHYENSLMKLSLARLRLSRWGESVQINLQDATKAQMRLAGQFSLDDQKQVGDILGNILALFADAERVADKYSYKAAKNAENSPLHEGSDELLQKMKELVIRRRQKQTNILRKTGWVLYDQKQFNRLLEDITEFVGALEELFPATTTQTELAVKEVQELRENPQFDTLKKVSHDVDGTFHQVSLRPELNHHFQEIHVHGVGRLVFGDVSVPGDESKAPKHNYVDITIEDHPTVVFGNLRTGKSPFDP